MRVSLLVVALMIGFTASASVSDCFNGKKIKQVELQTLGGARFSVKYARKGAGGGKVKVSAYYIEQPIVADNFTSEEDAKNWINEIGTELKSLLCQNTPSCQTNSYVGAQVTTETSSGKSDALIHKVVCR